MTAGGSHSRGGARGGYSRISILAVIVALGLGARMWALTFGLPLVLARPDELFVIGIAVKMHVGDPNPRMFEYPGLYLYLLAGLFAIYYWWGRLTGRFAAPSDFSEAFWHQWEPFFLVPRAVSAALGTATILLCHAIAAPLFGTATALLSAFFMALAFLHVRDSHYATTDVTMTFFLMCSVLALTRLYRGRASRDAWFAGIFAGLATATKYNAVLIAIPMLAVEVLHAVERRAGWRQWGHDTQLLRMCLAGAGIFLAANPYLLLDYSTAVEQLGLLHASTTLGMTPPEMLGRGWTYHGRVSLRYGLGLPLLTAALGGLLWMAWRRPALALVLGSFPLSYYVIAGAGYNVFVRYMIPVVPFLCIFAAFGVAELSAALSRWTRIRSPIAAGVLGAAIVAPSAWSVVRFDWLLSQEDSRIVAARWVHEHVAPGSTIYMSGNRYGHLQLERGPVARYKYFEYNWRAERFTSDSRASEMLPEWIVVQRSALPYSHIPPPVERLLTTDYHLTHVVRAANLDARGNVYDVQDGFYVPFGGFKGVRRPGPNLEIYRRRSE